MPGNGLDDIDLSQWQWIGNKHDFGVAVKVLVVGTRRIAVWSDGNRVIACLARCPHGSYVMDSFETHGPLLTCPLHGWRFDMGRGGCEIHGYEGLRELKTIVVNDDIYLDNML